MGELMLCGAGLPDSVMIRIRAAWKPESHGFESCARKHFFTSRCSISINVGFYLHLYPYCPLPSWAASNIDTN